jgi:hypothetical protein
VDQLDQDAPLEPQRSSDSGPPPEFLNPESPRYQPWAEKQITNATKEKRPLAEFLAEFDARLAAIGQRESGNWDPQHNERLLARFSSGGAAPARRRRRRRPGGRPPVQSQVAGVGVGQPAAAGQPQAKAGAGTNSASRRRRRRRPRGGHRGPEGGSGT